jgi:hypothetical protein
VAVVAQVEVVVVAQVAELVVQTQEVVLHQLLIVNVPQLKQFQDSKVQLSILIVMVTPLKLLYPQIPVYLQHQQLVFVVKQVLRLQDLLF